MKILLILWVVFGNGILLGFLETGLGLHLQAGPYGFWGGVLLKIACYTQGALLYIVFKQSNNSILSIGQP